MSHQDDLQKPGAAPEEEYKRVFAHEEFWETAPLMIWTTCPARRFIPTAFSSLR